MIMPAGMCDFQESMGRPTMRWLTPSDRRWAEVDRPFAPAPMIRTSSADTLCSLSPRFGRGRLLSPPLLAYGGQCDSAFRPGRFHVAPVDAVNVPGPEELRPEDPQCPAPGHAVGTADPPVVVAQPAHVAMQPAGPDAGLVPLHPADLLPGRPPPDHHREIDARVHRVLDRPGQP